MIEKYQEKIKYYASLDMYLQRSLLYDAGWNIERYRDVLLTMKKYNDMEFYNLNYPVFNQYNSKFKGRIGTEDEPTEDIENTSQMDSLLESLPDSVELEKLLEGVEFENS